ncbi:hypothetical protein [Streptomyces sp. NPDC051909]|uniref:hypothetical protein n=1 Tax=Streptomyces sp. NPDC051909 TaxID=3154944 RepID=UPI00341503B1
MRAGTGDAANGESALISAVRAGDPAEVSLLLHRDSRPDSLEAAFSLAVRAYDGHVAQLLLRFGADPGQCGPDALPPLGEAVAFGSPALVEALLDHRIRDRDATSELRDARDLALRRHETGAEAELRRRTGSGRAAPKRRPASARPGATSGAATAADPSRR